MNPDVFIELLRSSGLKLKTYEAMRRLVVDMVHAESEDKGWKLVYELQGMLNAFALQGDLSSDQHKVLVEELAQVWKPIARKLVVKRLASEFPF